MTHLSRRGFLDRAMAGLTIGAGLPAWYASKALAEVQEAGARARRKIGPNDEIVMAAIGVGGQGTYIMKKAMAHPGVRFVAVCDVDAERREKAAAVVKDKQKGDCATYADFRELLARGDIDAVTIGTVDHWHALTSIAAMKAGCDVYCEKPLALTIAEGQAMVQAARKYDRIFQVGSMQRSDPRYRLACELVRNGRLGKVHTVEARIGENPIGGPFKEVAVPNGLDWDFWKGPTADIPYVKERCHYTFRWWYEYSGGKLTDWGAHHVDIGQWAIGMEDSGPKTIEVQKRVLPVDFKGGYPTVDDRYNTANAFIVHATFANGVVLEIRDDTENGVRFQGEHGHIFVTRDRIDLDGGAVGALYRDPVSESLLKELRKGKAVAGHMENFFECLVDRSVPVSDVWSHHRALSTCHLANIALRLDRKKLEWDAEKEQIVGDSEANAFLSRPQRKGYEIG